MEANTLTEIKTLRDLKNFLSTLNDQQLDQEAILTREENYPLTLTDVTILGEESILIDDCGYVSKSEFNTEDFNSPFEEMGEVNPKGFVLLFAQ